MFFWKKREERGLFEFNKVTNRKIKTRKNLSFDEAFLDVQIEEQQVMDDERENINYRLLSGILFLCLAVLFGRVFFLQMIKGAEYKALAEGNKLRVQYVLAPRGLILDRYGKVLAGNVPSFELVVIPLDLPKEEIEYQKEIVSISQILGKQSEEISGLIGKMDKSSFSANTIIENLTKEQALILLSKANEIPGFAVQNNPIRDYKDAPVFAHLVGHTGRITQEELIENEDYLINDYIGKTGLELQYEKFLRGVAGKRQVEIDAQGNFKKILAEVPAVSGFDLRLNIDYDLQKKIYDSMREIMGRGRANRAAAIATNPRTGQVLALISLTSYHNNEFARGIAQEEYEKLLKDPDFPLLDRVISGTYPPGSTVKPMLGIAVLTDGVVRPDTKITDNGLIQVGNYTFYGYRHEGLGVMDIYSAIAQSSDIYFYTVGGGNVNTGFQGLGPDKVAEWYRKFHLGSVLGIDLPFEKSGLVPDPTWKERVKEERWYLGNTYHVSIGQGDLLATPLQVNNWTATIANGGKVMRPYILDEVIGKNNEILFKQGPEVLSENFLKQEYVKIVQDAMRQTIVAGSAQSLKTIPLEIAGKTGTAQFDAKNLNRTHAWFTSYAPAQDPQIALTILVESGGEGSSVSVPIAKSVYEWWAANRQNSSQ